MLSERRWRWEKDGGSTAQIVLSPIGGGQDLDNHIRQSNHVTVFVKSVVVTDGLAPGKVVLTVPEAVGVLVVVGLPQALGGDVDIVISGTLEPQDNEAKTPYRALKFARNSSL